LTAAYFFGATLSIPVNCSMRMREMRRVCLAIGWLHRRQDGLRGANSHVRQV